MALHLVGEEVSEGGNGKSKSSVHAKTSLASIESLVMPLVQEVVISADLKCAECQKRIADMISRMTEMDSVEVNVSKKTVTLTCRYPSLSESPTTKQVTDAICRKSPGRMAVLKRIFGSYCK